MKNWPRLSTSLNPFINVRTCQCCGNACEPYPELSGQRQQLRAIRLWQECDESDQPEPIVVALCDPCAEKIIEPHPRLYRRLSSLNHPIPGVTAVCPGCIFQEGSRCKCPESLANGGAGIRLKGPRPQRGFIDGVKYRGPFEFYSEPITACTGRKEK